MAQHPSALGKAHRSPAASCCLSASRILSQARVSTGPPGTNYAVMKKAFDEGWGAVIAKTVSLDCSKVLGKRFRMEKLRMKDNL